MTGEKTWDRAVATGMQTSPSGAIKIEPIPDGKRADTLQKAKKLGISGPILNKGTIIFLSFFLLTLLCISFIYFSRSTLDAAAAMSSLNPTNYGQPEDTE